MITILNLLSFQKGSLMHLLVFTILFSVLGLDTAHAANRLGDFHFSRKLESVTTTLKESCTSVREIIVNDSTFRRRNKTGFVIVYDIFLNYEDGSTNAYSNYSHIHTRLYGAILTANPNRCLKSVTVKARFSRLQTNPLGGGRLTLWYR
jgi:hypothetical protein